MAIKKVRLTMMVHVEDMGDGLPTVLQIGEHVMQEVNAAKGQFPPESWQFGLSAELETARLHKRKPRKTKP